MTLPVKALSIRHPWAWAVVHAGKHLENRDWGYKNNHMKRFRGPVCIHASSGITRAEYDDAVAFMRKYTQHVKVPPPLELVYGCIIGTAVVTDWVSQSPSPWFMGPGALVLEQVEAIDPIPCSGALGFFNWQERGIPARKPLPRWMEEYS